MQFLLSDDNFTKVITLAGKFQGLIDVYASDFSGLDELKRAFHQAAEDVKDSKILESLQSKLYIE